MNNALFLFLILLLGLVLCSFLGGNCYREGLTNEDSSQPQTGVTGDASIQSSLYDNYNHFAGTSSVSTNGTTYYFRIRAVNTMGSGPASNIVSKFFRQKSLFSGFIPILCKCSFFFLVASNLLVPDIEFLLNL